jgi:rRNA maturation protein Nop10
MDYEAEKCAACGYEIGFMVPAKADGENAYHKRCL